jgi:dolichyl-phosphate-mannose--protein O-mannosyl transferase
VPEALRRRLAPFEHRLDPYSWVVAGVITAIAAIVRLVALGRPRGIVFDETYYAVDAYGMLNYGVEWSADAPVGSREITFGAGPAFEVHPPLGKWLIAVGEWIFGYNEIGWRIAPAVAGIVSVLLVTRIGRRLFGSTVLGAAAGLLVALDGMHVVMSRFAMLDIFLLCFVLGAFGALLLDRDGRRRRWLTAVEQGVDPSRSGILPFDWRTGVPWWRLCAAVLMGCAVAVKWSAVFYLPVLVLLVLVWEAGARRSLGMRHPWRATLRDESGWLALAGLIIGVVYLVSWTGWLITDHGYYRHWLADNGRPEPPVFGALQNLIYYHDQALGFHTGLASTHSYQSWPWQWLLLGRPVLFYSGGGGACGAADCFATSLLLGTPLLWWSFLPALLAMAWVGIARRDWRPAAIGLGAAAGILPWFWYALDGRTMFFFYALPAQPFLVLAVVYVLGALITSPRAGPDATLFGFDRRTVGVVIAGCYVILVAVNFAWFYPIYVAEDIPRAAWQARMWLGNRWI